MALSSIITGGYSTTKETAALAKDHDMNVAYFVLMAFNICIIAPVGIWFTAGYYKNRHKHQYISRRPKLVIFHNLFSLFFVAIYIPIHISCFEIVWDNNGTDSEWWDIVTWYSMLIAVNLSLSLRVWHSFYDFQLAYYSSRRWKAILGDDIWHENPPFLFRYKHILSM